ncbi:MAG: hypothetical protein Q7K65_04425 [Candidatus Buchananbacteria bacterium]|nr:hypothetical protein [Candidatus Buchananbacteria bacterium]
MTQAQTTPVQTTGTADNPNCTCCAPPQPLEPPANNEQTWTCPVTGKKYEYDPADGSVQRVPDRPVNRQVIETEDDGLFPKPPTREEVRRVNPQDPFA